MYTVIVSNKEMDLRLTTVQGHPTCPAQVLITLFPRETFCILMKFLATAEAKVGQVEIRRWKFSNQFCTAISHFTKTRRYFFGEKKSRNGLFVCHKPSKVKGINTKLKQQGTLSQLNEHAKTIEITAYYGMCTKCQNQLCRRSQ